LEYSISFSYSFSKERQKMNTFKKTSFGSLVLSYVDHIYHNFRERAILWFADYLEFFSWVTHVSINYFYLLDLSVLYQTRKSFYHFKGSFYMKIPLKWSGAKVNILSRSRD